MWDQVFAILKRSYCNPFSHVSGGKRLDEVLETLFPEWLTAGMLFVFVLCPLVGECVFVSLVAY